MTKRRMMVAILMGWMLAGGAASAEQGAEVVQSVVQLQRRSFDPKQPPADMPPMKPGEAALTEFNYGCSAEVSYIRNQGEGADRVTIQSVQMNISLSITIWLPKKTTQKLNNHEEGHKQIGQTIYNNSAQQAARQAAEPLVGKVIDVAGMSDEAIQRVVNDHVQQACDRYMKSAPAHAGRVGEAYDRITDHGRNRIDEQTAIKRAFEQAE
jgi:hypothetical protein